MDDALLEGLSTTEDIIDAAKMANLHLVDDEDRENEGDVCILAEHATPEAINFMAKYARGLIYVRLSGGGSNSSDCLMEQRHESATRQPLPIDRARDGVTTGISRMTAPVRFRSRPIRNTMRHISRRRVISSRSWRDGGTLVRAGHTEAVVDIARAPGPLRVLFVRS